MEVSRRRKFWSTKNLMNDVISLEYNLISIVQFVSHEIRVTPEKYDLSKKCVFPSVFPKI